MFIWLLWVLVVAFGIFSCIMHNLVYWSGIEPRAPPPTPRWEQGVFTTSLGFSSDSDGKASVCSAGDPGSVPGLGRSPGEGNDSPLQYSCLENPMDAEAW